MTIQSGGGKEMEKGIEIDYPKIKEILARKRIKQWELAKKVGVCETHLSKVMVGRLKPSKELVNKICKALKIDQASIMPKRR